MEAPLLGSSFTWFYWPTIKVSRRRCLENLLPVIANVPMRGKSGLGNGYSQQLAITKIRQR
jgi:hypothetical protein